MIVELIGRSDRERARNLVREAGLAFEETCENLVGVFEGKELVATGARQGNVLKMFAIAPAHRSGPLLGELVTELIRLGYEAGVENFFVFTSPDGAPSFEALNFVPLVHHPKAVLLEYGGGLQRYLQRHAHLVRPGENGGVVVNCNPFTLGHRYLVEEAARRVETLYIFVVREDRSVFPFDVRLRLVREGVKDIRNAVVLDSDHYAVSAITFPSYFLKGGADEAAAVQMEIDVELFGRHLAPFFHVKRRFIGTEPYCRTTHLYSETMRRLLPAFGVETVQLDRRETGGEAISAYRVREALRREAYETVRRLVPETTLDYLLSEEAAPIREKLRTYDRRH